MLVDFNVHQPVSELVLERPEVLRLGHLPLTDDEDAMLGIELCRTTADAGIPVSKSPPHPYSPLLSGFAATFSAPMNGMAP